MLLGMANRRQIKWLISLLGASPGSIQRWNGSRLKSSIACHKPRSQFISSSLGPIYNDNIECCARLEMIPFFQITDIVKKHPYERYVFLAAFVWCSIISSQAKLQALSWIS